MNHEQQKSLLEGALSDIRLRKPPLGGDEVRVPVSVYLDEQRFQAERLLHRRALNLVAHRSELPAPGAFLAVDIADVPVLLVRGDDGVVRAFLNVCRHRGARVERRSQGRCRKFVCPYHAWTYRTDGALDQIRHPEGFPSLDASSSGLTALACVEDGPFVWVCPTPGLTPALDEHARALVAEIEAMGLGGLEVFAREGREWGANWKLLVEGGLESYHFKIAHRKTIGSMFTDTSSTFELHGDHIRSVLPRASVRELDGAPDEDWRLLRHANVLYTFSPNASVLVQDGHYVVIVMTPLAVGRSRVDTLTVGRPVPAGAPGEKVQAFLSANHGFTVKTLGEDFVLAEEIQRGLGTGANETLRFGRFEDALSAWHQRLEARLRV